jgi:hypothetical protein
MSMTRRPLLSQVNVGQICRSAADFRRMSPDKISENRKNPIILS